MKKLKFSKNLVDKILNGTKTSTWRLFDDKDLSVGDEIIFIDKDSGEEFAKAEIINVREKKFADLDDKDWEGHERYDSEEEMYATYSKYYGREIIPDTIVKLIDFRII